LAALLHLMLSRRTGWWIKATAVALLALSLLIAGGTLRKRLWRATAQVADASSSAELAIAIDKVSNSRLAMLRDGVRMLARFPASGVGAGNFLFYLKYLRFGEPAWLDLPLNQYLLVFSETGLPGGLAFLFFLAALLRRRQPARTRVVLAAMAFALIFNNFFWFPEVLLLFWVVVSQGQWGPAAGSKGGTVWATAAVLLFVAMNMAGFQALHPRAWARERGTPYDYGFSYPERENGREFRWSGEQAGMVIHRDKEGAWPETRLFCAAPLAFLPGKQQAVEVFWRGRPYRQLVFRENGESILRIADKDGAEGFLEFRVRPAFNLKRLGLGPERRELGVQVALPGD